MTTDLPISRIYDLNRLSEAGYEAVIEPAAEDLAKLAAWADVSAVNRFAGRVSLKRISSTCFTYTAHLDAEIVQACAVSLEPVSSSIAMDFTRPLHLVPHAAATLDFSGELAPGAGDDEAPEEIESTKFDLAGPLLEEFVLAIDPYPRAPDIAFEAPAVAAEEKESPFAALAKLKGKE